MQAIARPLLAFAVALSSAAWAQDAPGSAQIQVHQTYAEKVRASIQPVVYSGLPMGNPVAIMEITTTEEGVIVGRRLLKSSGDLGWDKAVYLAVYKTDVIPLDVNGRVPHKLEISFSPGSR